MRSQDRTGLSRAAGAIALAGAVLAAAVALSQELALPPPELSGGRNPMETGPVPPLPRPVTDDRRQMRNYPEQPPVIPHSISGYQLTLRANRCLECHRREFTAGSGAPMISITHFMDRDYQVLSDVSPRRYFCLQCHVPQTEARPLVENAFTDMSKLRAE
jgi:cytochrome c-type protein NapB